MSKISIRNFLSSLTCFALLSGCAFTHESINLNYSLTEPLAEAFTTKPNESIQVGDIQDKRGVNDQHIIFNKKNMNGNTTSGAYLAEKPIGVIIHEAIDSALTKANFNINQQNAPYQLYGNLMDLNYEIIMGVVSGEFRPKITVQLYLKDIKSGRVVWNETFIGRSSIKSSWGGNDMIRNGLNSALDDLVKQITASDTLKSSLIMSSRG